MNILWHYFRSLESSVLHHPHQIFPFSLLSLSASCHAIFYARLSILLRNANAFRLSSPREVILLEREDRSQLFCVHFAPRVIFPVNVNTSGWKYYSLKMIVPKRSLRGIEFREGNSLKLQSFLHSTFEDRYRFLVIIIVGTQHDVITRFPSHFYYSFSRSLRSAIFSSPSSSVSPIM